MRDRVLPFLLHPKLNYCNCRFLCLLVHAHSILLMQEFPCVLLFACGSYCGCLIECVAVHLPIMPLVARRCMYVCVRVCGWDVTPMLQVCMYMCLQSVDPGQ